LFVKDFSLPLEMTKLAAARNDNADVFLRYFSAKMARQRNKSLFTKLSTLNPVPYTLNLEFT